MAAHGMGGARGLPWRWHLVTYTTAFPGAAIGEGACSLAFGSDLHGLRLNDRGRCRIPCNLRHGREKRVAVWVVRRSKHFLNQTALHQLTAIEHAHAMCQGPYNGEVV